MKIKDGMELEYKQTVEENSHDVFGLAAIRYVERWVNMMEDSIAAGSTLQEAADSTWLLADTEGITGSMYGCAVGLLSRCWVYGEELRMWHNHEYGHEEKGTVDPSVPTIKSADKTEGLEQSGDAGPQMGLR